MWHSSITVGLLRTTTTPTRLPATFFALKVRCRDTCDRSPGYHRLRARVYGHNRETCHTRPHQSTGKFRKASRLPGSLLHKTATFKRLTEPFLRSSALTDAVTPLLKVCKQNSSRRPNFTSADAAFLKPSPQNIFGR